MADEYADRLARLSDDRRRALELLRRRRAETTVAVARHVPRTAERRLPLSIGQEQLWFLYELQPEQPTYNIVQASSLDGPLDHGALRRALDRLVERHEALRITFGTDDGRPYQVANPPGRAELAYDDLGGAVRDRPPDQAALDLLREQEVHRPFNLRTGPVFRARLIRLDDRTHVLSVAMHHIIGDGWSMGLALSDLAELYRAELLGAEPELPDLAIQFGDFVVWQREQLRSPWMNAHVEYWCERLAKLEPLDLPTDRPRPSSATFRGATVGYDFAPETWQRVQAYAARRGVSVNSVLVAGFNAVLARYSGQDDLATGVTLACRTRPELESVVGYFANMGVVRLDLSGDPSFGAMVDRAADALIGAIEHQEAPFELVIERLTPPRDPACNPLFQSAFQLLDARTWSAPRIEGTRATAVDLRLERARFDLITSVIDRGDRCTSLTEYSTDLFDEARIVRMLGHFERVLAAGTREPVTRLSALPLVGPDELKTVSDFAVGERRAYRRAAVHELVFDQAAATPDAVAVRDGDRDIGYAELRDRARALAATLVAEGVGAGDLIGSLAETGIDEIVTILGVVSAGGVYMPLDPTAPAARVTGILDRAGAPLAVARPALAPRLAAAASARVLELDPGTGPLTGPAAAADTAVNPSAPAYALHTSGSTGDPKPVLLSHGAFANFLDWMTNAWSLGPGDRVLHVCAPVFDLSSAEILAPLSRGACVVVAPRDTILTPGTLTRLVRDEAVTHLFVTPTMLSLLEPDRLPALREVMVAGEPCPSELVWRWRAPGRRVRNLYGPTETTVGCTAEDVTDWDGPQLPPIGAPMPNRSVHILEPSGAPAPIGVPGEIVIGGEGLAAGYLGDAERTAEHFVDLPPATEGEAPLGRVYRSGDLGYWDEQGRIRILGRRDTQIKLRGLRVELGEIEGLLGRFPGVAQAAVAVHKDAAGSQSLVAYIVPEDEPVDPRALREHLARELPPALVPGVYVSLTALPRTATDKVDRRALPAPAIERGAGESRREPGTAAERLVARTFGELLGVERVGADDSFFELGGHSLQAARILARLAKASGTVIALKDFYAEPTVGAVARMLDTATDASAHTRRSVLVTLKAAGDRPRLYCVHAVSGSPFWYTGLSRSLPAEQPVDAFEAPGMEGEEEPLEDLVPLAARYVKALLERQPEGPHLLAGWSLGGFVAFEMARQLAAAGRPPRLVAMIDSAAPGPLPRPSEGEIAAQFVSDMAGVAGREAPAVDQDLDGISAAERLERLSRILTAANLVPGDVPDSFMVNRFAVFRANMLAIHAYRPRPYPGRIALFQAAAEASRAPWKRFAMGGCDEVTLPGTHYSIWSPDRLPRLTENLERLIESSLAR